MKIDLNRLLLLEPMSLFDYGGFYTILLNKKNFSTFRPKTLHTQLSHTGRRSRTFHVFDVILFWGKHGQNYSKAKKANVISNTLRKIQVLKYLFVKT